MTDVRDKTPASGFNRRAFISGATDAGSWVSSLQVAGYPLATFPMNAKDSVVGTAKQIVAEIVGDGRLAEEGSCQASGNRPLSAPEADVDGLPQNRSRLPDGPFSQASKLTEDDRFASLLGHASLKVWSDLPWGAQERLHAVAVDDGVIANSLAVFLHDRHPKTAHPPKPSMIA